MFVSGNCKLGIILVKGDPIRTVVREICPPVVWNVGRKVFGPFLPAKQQGPNPISPEEAELRRLWSLPKYTRASAQFLGRNFKATCPRSFASVYDSCFRKGCYCFSPSTATPLILDCGANVGITVHYWKHLCPGARVIAFEPDEANFEALTFNCSGLEDVMLRREAVWIKNGTIRFASVGGDAGHLSELTMRRDSPKHVTVPAVRLRDLLNEPVELLKMDIEGAEVDVILDCADRLDAVRFLFVEFHSFIGKPQRLAELLNTIEKAGFRIRALPEPVTQPFLSRPVLNEMDFHMDIYGIRE